MSDLFFEFVVMLVITHLFLSITTTTTASLSHIESERRCRYFFHIFKFLIFGLEIEDVFEIFKNHLHISIRVRTSVCIVQIVQSVEK